MKKQPRVSVLVVTYNNEQYIKSIFYTLAKQTYHNSELIIVDNNSQDKTISLISQFTNRYKQFNTTLIQLQSNTGFANANNVAVKKAEGELLFFMNSDIYLDEKAIENTVAEYKKRKKCAGIAPKIYLAKLLPTKAFDSIGICIDKNGSPYNRGIGQLDLGQYDFAERIAGCCFGCALIKKKVYVQLGGLDSSYFAYFEDVDFCIRARKSGYEFYSSPEAVAYHDHSASSSKKSYSWKYYLIFRNYLRTTTKSYGKKTAVRIVLQKISDLIKVSVRATEKKDIRQAAFKVVLNYLLIDWWKYSIKRKGAQKYYNKDCTDEFVFSFSINEPSNYFDPVNYKLINQKESINYIVARLARNRKRKNKRFNKQSKPFALESYYCIDSESRQRLINKLVNKP